MKISLLSAAFMAMIVFMEKDKIVGRWETPPSENGAVTGVVFKSDNSFEGYVNRKPFVTGIYSYQDSILKFTDNACDGAEGIYKIAFFSDADSLRFVTINDPCVDRQKGMSRLVMGRVK